MKTKWCEACQQEKLEDEFPLIWDINTSNYRFGEMCNFCHEWYTEGLFRELKRTIEIKERKEKTE